MNCRKFPDNTWEKTDRELWIGGRIDYVHAFRLLLCQNDNDIHGILLIENTQAKIFLEGVQKADSILLIEYDKNSSVVATYKFRIEGTHINGVIVEPSYRSLSKLDGELIGFDQPIPRYSQREIIVYNTPLIKKKSALILSYDNNRTRDGLFFDGQTFQTLRFTDRESDTSSHIINLFNTRSNEKIPARISKSAETVQLSDSKILTQSVSLQESSRIPVAYKELYDRNVSYEISYPITGQKKLDEVLVHYVNKIKFEFDSLKLRQRQNKKFDNMRFAPKMVAWFEPTYIGSKWFCGYFMVQANVAGISKMIPINYSKILKKHVEINDLIISPDEEPDWTAILDSADILKDRKQKGWDNPVLTYGGIMFTTPFDRIYGRQIVVSDRKKLALKWTWWKPEYWLIASTKK